MSVPPEPAELDWFAGPRVWLRGEIRRRKVRQCQLADTLGITEKHLSQVLHGKVRNPQALAGVAAELGFVFVLTPDLRA